MYRVAVIQNESEMLRSGFTNMIPKFSSIEQLSHYSFELFNVVNIHKLFEEGDSHLRNYDSLLVTTNASSDITVLLLLQAKKNVIAEFIAKGKGIFIASQKKLSTSSPDTKTKSGQTMFLPAPYEYLTIVRPKIEKDSGFGSISIFNNDKNILLKYPTTVTTELTEQHCINNEFKRHFYRSHIVPITNGSYLPILVDNSYSDVNNRNLLMVNLVPQNGERIVISTIALDWEFHKNLLTNIITYITEGLPKVAFIDKATEKHGDFDFLLTSAKLSKIPHIIYGSVGEIREELNNIHNTYIFSPDWDENEVNKFIQNIDSKSIPSTTQKNYVRVYSFKQLYNILTLNQYSNFSTIDLITDSSVLWVNSKYPEGMWNKSFWITYDILLMFHDIGIDISSYIAPILKDISRHYLDNSYDGVTGATCGMLELFLLMDKYYHDELTKEGFTNTNIKGIINWLLEKYESQSMFDKQTLTLTLNKYYSVIFNENKYNIDQNIYEAMLDVVKSHTHTEKAHILKHSEIDLCRIISVSLICNEKENEISELLLNLKRIQNPSGKWTNTGRTAHVLVFLLKNLSKLKRITNSNFGVDDMIYNGILHLRSEYNWGNSNWDDDLQATAKAIHAIGLYNKLYKYSTQDFFKTLEIESDKIYSASVIHNVSETMRNLRHHSNEMNLKIESLSEDKINIHKTVEEQKVTINANDRYENEIAKQIIRTKTIATIFGSLFVSFVFYLWLKYPIRVAQEFKQIDITGIILGFVIGLILTNIAQRTVGRTELLKKIRNKKKLNK